ncbi:hypothetical protein TNCV_3917921 [Trichonephila clavipes]|nr:hypothetical protein TNCV_3917921 [Trichonephila clavipes]
MLSSKVILASWVRFHLWGARYSLKGLWREREGRHLNTPKRELEYVPLSARIRTRDLTETSPSMNINSCRKGKTAKRLGPTPMKTLMSNNYLQVTAWQIFADLERDCSFWRVPPDSRDFAKKREIIHLLFTGCPVNTSVQTMSHIEIKR